MEQVDSMEMIGRGEVVAKKILRDMFPEAEILTQVPLYKLLTNDWRLELSERQQKETIDIVVKRKFRKVLCVRIQDKHHFSERFYRIDATQRHLLEESHCEVVDIPENECPYLFKDRYNSKSMSELNYYLKPYL